MVSVASHLVTHDLRAMFDAYAAGEVGKARDIHRSLLPVYTGVFRAQGVITTKAALRQLGLPGGPGTAAAGRPDTANNSTSYAAT